MKLKLQKNAQDKLAAVGGEKPSWKKRKENIQREETFDQRHKKYLIRRVIEQQ